ncbi:MAG: CopG family transcriptional regulator [Vicinamibacterales bacterium]
MRTTLDIDDDVLAAAREIADQRRSTAGKVLSELARRGLTRPDAAVPVRNGVPILPRRAAGQPRPTLQLVNRLRDEG